MNRLLPRRFQTQSAQLRVQHLVTLDPIDRKEKEPKKVLNVKADCLHPGRIKIAHGGHPDRRRICQVREGSSVVQVELVLAVKDSGVHSKFIRRPHDLIDAPKSHLTRSADGHVQIQRVQLILKGVYLFQA